MYSATNSAPRGVGARMNWEPSGPPIWIIAWSTGNDELDRQHKYLCRMVMDFGMALSEGQGGGRTYGVFLQVLSRYSAAHFGQEQACMLAAFCPAAGDNEKGHRGFTRKLESATRRFESHGYEHATALKLTAWLAAWIVNHIGKIDVQLRDSILSAGVGTG